MAQQPKYTKQREVSLNPYKARFTKQRTQKRGVLTTTTLPTLASIAPTTGTAAGAPLLITCTGTNFVPGITKVTVSKPGTASGGTDQYTTYVSATSVTFLFPRPAIAGTYGVNVHNGEKFSTTVRTLTIT